jgi:hypothetical protein
MITVVSGIPRSGTSTMMQMISAGGMPAVSDDLRNTDESNPRGYLEWQAVKSLPQTPNIIDAAENKAVKVTSEFLLFLPSDHEYRIIFMCRPLEQVVASQEKFFQRLGHQVPRSRRALATATFQRHLKKVRLWLREQPNISVLYVDYSAVLASPFLESSRICVFLGHDLDVAAMAAEIDGTLHRER